MNTSKILFPLLALGFLASMTTNVEGQLFRRFANPCCQQYQHAIPANNCCQSRIVWQRRQSCCQNPCQSMNARTMYPSAPIISNGCGCGNSTGIMSGGVVTNNGGVLTPYTPGPTPNGPIIFSGQTKESCQSTYEACLAQCESCCTENLEACKKHCKCNRDICDPTIKANCNDPRAPNQPEQPDPNPARRN